MTRIAALLGRCCGSWVLAASSMFLVPSLAQERSTDTPPLPPGELGEWVRLGEAIVEKTTEHPLSKPFLGNDLNCTSCHLQNGRHPSAGSFLGTATAYPAWAPREKTLVTLEDRVLNCFMRSCNGVRPPLGSKVSIAIQAYITWLSQGDSMRMNPQRPVGPRAVPLLPVKPDNGSLERGRALYVQRCADCHGADGKGDTDNPPVWGERSYNDGAGLAKVENLGAWLKVAMPLDDATLTEQEAIDVAVFVNSHPRPRFDLSAHLPPPAETGVYNGERP